MVPLASNTLIGGARHARILGRRRLRLLVDLSVGLWRPMADRDRPLPLARSPVVESRPWQHAGRRGSAARAVRARRDRHRRVSASPSGARWAVSIVLIASRLRSVRWGRKDSCQGRVVLLASDILL